MPVRPDAQRQAREQMAKNAKASQRRRQLLNPPTKFESDNESDYYLGEIYPKLQSGLIVSCELHKEFLLYPAREYCGMALPAAVFTPDFVLEYANGTIEVVEIKGRTVRKLQRDFTLRRRLFIEIWAIPNKWVYTERIIDD